MKNDKKRIIQVLAGLGVAAFLAVLSWAGEMAGGTTPNIYRITRDDVNAGGLAMEAPGSYFLTGSLGGVDTGLISSPPGPNSNTVLAGLPGIYFYPDTITDVAPAADISGGSPNILHLTWTAPRGEVPAKDLGAPGSYPSASSYVIKYSSTTSITDQASFESAATAAALPGPVSAGVAQTFSIPGLLANTSYFIGIESVDASTQTGKDASYFSNFASTYTLCNTPDGLIFVGKSTNSVFLGWNPRNDRLGVSVTYDAQRSTDSLFANPQTFQTVSASTIQVTYNFTSLALGAPYFFHVRAYNGAGVPSPWSVPVTTTVEVGLPGFLPFSAQTTNSLTANWDPGFNALGVGVAYEARLDDDINFNSYDTLPAPAGVDVFSASFPGLLTNTTYFALVRAVPPLPGQPSNFSGPVWTMTNVFRGSTDTYTAFADSATFTWNAPAGNNIHSFFYRVDVSTDFNYSGNVFSSTVPSGPAPFPPTGFTSISGLIPNTVYYARLVTLNGIMIPSAQGAFPFAPRATLPRDPALAGFTAVDDHQILLGWDHNGNNPAQSRYEINITSHPAGNFDVFPGGFVSSTATTAPGATGYLFTSPVQLLANTTYFARIKTKGSAADSNYVLFGATPTAPTAATGMTFSGLTISTITVGWSNVNGPARNGPDTRYRVDILDIGGTPLQAPQTVTALSATFNGLATNTTCYFRVTALTNSASWPDAAPLLGARSTLAAAPGTPAGFSGVTDTTMTVSWASGVNPAGTDYRVDVSSDAAYLFISTSAQGTDLFSKLFGGLSSNTTYYARAWGVSHSGDLSATSLNIGVQVTAVRTPIMLNNFDTYPSSITVRWDGDGNAPDTRYRLEDWGALVDDNVIGPLFNHLGIPVNSSHSYHVLAYNRAGNPTVFSNTISTWTRAATPPKVTILGNGPISNRMALNTGLNPNGPWPAAARTEYAIQAATVTPNGLPNLAGLYLGSAPGGDVFNLDSSSTTPVWRTAAQWDTDADGQFTAAGLQPGRAYYWVVYARNGDAADPTSPLIPTPAGPNQQGTTISGAPVVYLKGYTGLDSTFVDVWVNTLTIPFQARGAFNTYYDFTQSPVSGIVASPTFDPNYYFTKPMFSGYGAGAHGWSGVNNPTFPVAPLAPADAPLVDPPVDYADSLAGFHAAQSGRWFLHVVGDAYAPWAGYNIHETFALSGASFRVLVDTTPANPLAMGLTAFRRPGDIFPLPAGQQVGWDRPYFQWSDPDQNTPNAPQYNVSPTIGYSYVFSTNFAAVPQQSSDTARNTSSVGFADGFKLKTGVIDGFQTLPLTAAATYYFKVMSLDQAGNWSAPAVYVYDVVPDITPPSTFIDFGPSVRVASNGTTVAVSTSGVIQVLFSELMNPNQTDAAAFNLTLVKDERNQPMGSTVTIGVSYNALASSPTATITPAAGLRPGCRYLLTSTPRLEDVSGNVVSPPLNAPFYTLMSPTLLNVVPVDASTNPVSIVTFNPGSWNGGYAGLAINQDPTNQPMAAPGIAGLISKANNALDHNGRGYGKPLAIHEFNLYDPSALRMSGAFNQAVQLSMRYNDANGNGIVDETEGGPNPVRVSALCIYWLDDDTGAWVRLPGSVVDTATRRVTAQVRHFSVYGLLGAPAMDLANAYAYPVPYKPGIHVNGIRFTNLSSVATIKVFTVNGDLVKTLQEADGDGVLTWNPVTNEAGEPLASDVYIYLIQNDQQKKTGKLLVVR